MFLWIVKEITERENVNEKLKAENAMLWVSRMNNIQAREIVNSELIYA